VEIMLIILREESRENPTNPRREKRGNPEEDQRREINHGETTRCGSAPFRRRDPPIPRKRWLVR
jgi:hypothetical protein